MQLVAPRKPIELYIMFPLGLLKMGMLKVKPVQAVLDMLLSGHQHLKMV